MKTSLYLHDEAYLVTFAADAPLVKCDSCDNHIRPKQMTGKIVVVGRKDINSVTNSRPAMDFKVGDNVIFEYHPNNDPVLEHEGQKVVKVWDNRIIAGAKTVK